MEFRLRSHYVILIVAALLISSCSKNAIDSETNFAGGSISTSVSEVSSHDSSYQSRNSVETSAYDLLKLEDGRHIVRIYLDPDCYNRDDSGAIIQVGVERYGDEYMRYYSDDEIDSLSVGDTLSIDDDISIKIKSTTIEDNKIVNKAWYGTGEFFIRISDHYILVHPQDTGDGLYQDVKDYWLLGLLNDYGNYDYLGKYIGKTSLRIADDCRIVYEEHDWSPVNDEEIAKGNPYAHIIKIEELPAFLAGSDKDKILFYRAGIVVSDGKVIDISFAYDDAEYCGG